MKFSKGDVMSLDETLAPIILAGLKEFKESLLESKYGSYPAKMLDLIGVEGNIPTSEEDEDCWNMWLEILDKMVYAFDPEEEPSTDDYEFEFEWREEPTENGNSLVSIDVDNLDEYSRYRQDEEDWNERCREGRLLFAQFYESLWI